jgi:valyl-tRNA synthetase
VQGNCLAIQDLVLRQVLQLANPLIPHITEELWEALGYAVDQPFIQKTVIAGPQEVLGQIPIDTNAAQRVGDLQELITRARALKAKYNLANKRTVTMFYSAGAKATEVIAANLGLICNLAGLDRLDAIQTGLADGLPAAVTPLGSLYLDLSASIDVDAEKARLNKELTKLDGLFRATEGKLNNAKFTANAPKHVVAGARKQLLDITQKRDDTRRILNSL